MPEQTGLAGLGYLNQAQTQRRATPKDQIVPRQLAKEQDRKEKGDKAEAFRKAVWKRDEGKCRATGVRLVKSGTTDWEKLGEVDHSIPRSLAPERIYDVSNGLLLQKRLNRLRKVACRLAPEFRMFDYEAVNPEETDRGKSQRFIWRDERGIITKMRTN